MACSCGCGSAEGGDAVPHQVIVATEAIEHSTAALVLLGKGSKRTADKMLEVLPIKYLRLSLIAAENLSSVGRYLRITQFPPFFLFML